MRCVCVTKYRFKTNSKLLIRSSFILLEFPMEVIALIWPRQPFSLSFVSFSGFDKLNLSFPLCVNSSPQHPLV